ncbi:hypothetical protein AKO1_014422 [Acrasis kona]|uniref:Uncharacterized protein n=1 Tax=Acrasis kona TaxID=1008807 RepID=A0AAW2Z191_9EUKA
MSKTTSTSKVSDVTEVASNSIWRERVKNELGSFTLNEQFTAHPTKMNVVTDKPNKRGNRFLDKDEALLQSLCKTYIKSDHPLHDTIPKVEQTQKTLNPKDSKFNELLSQTSKTPTEKYSYPITASQEIGWFNNEAVSGGDRFHHPRNMCNETIYADALIRSSTVQKSGSKKDAK